MMSINLRQTINHALTKNNNCNPQYNGMGLETWEYVSENTKDEKILTEEFYQTFEDMVNQEGVYLDLIPNDGMIIKTTGMEYKIYQEIEVNNKITLTKPIVMDYMEFAQFIDILSDPYEGHYGIAITEDDGEIDIICGNIGPADPSGHCPPAFYSLGENGIDGKIEGIIKNSIVYET